MPINPGLSGRIFSVGSFSSQERYLSYLWGNPLTTKEVADRYGYGIGRTRDVYYITADENEKMGIYDPLLTYGGLGIYDTHTQQSWQQEGATLAAWSVSGDQLVFGRYSFQGKYLRGYEHEPSHSPPRFFERSSDALLADLHLFRKDVRHLREAGAERITLTQAAHLVGAWYRPALLCALQKSPVGLSTLSGNIFASHGRGIVFMNYRDVGDDPNDSFLPPTAPLDLMEWSTRYIDARGQTALYKPSPPIFPFSWSRDGERLYGKAQTSTVNSSIGNAFLCFWPRSGKYAEVPLPEELGTPLSYIED